MSRIENSDKFYWHRYLDAYLPAFRRLGDVSLVVEFGVLRGDSVAWLAECFPAASVVGVDILPTQPEWPASPRIAYRQADQGDRRAIGALLDALPGRPDLIVEDGSHAPRHQVNCLVEGFSRLRPGGLYVLEDIGTSHPSHPTRAGEPPAPTALHVLLALQHRRDAGLGLDGAAADALAHRDFFSPGEVAALFGSVREIELFRRTKLPLRCYACGGNEFDYVGWRCRCGVELFAPADSMSCLIWKAAD
jgi:hypothetical protein